MLYLIQYDRARGTIVSLTSFVEQSRAAANDTRLALELGLSHQSSDHEVVLLEAPDEQTLRHTHRRYFENFAGIVESVGNR